MGKYNSQIYICLLIHLYNVFMSCLGSLASFKYIGSNICFHSRLHKGVKAWESPGNSSGAMLVPCGTPTALSDGLLARGFVVTVMVSRQTRICRLTWLKVRGHCHFHPIKHNCFCFTVLLFVLSQNNAIVLRNCSLFITEI